MTDPASETVRAGTRLRPRLQVERGAAAGAEGVLVGWHDTQLEVDCRFLQDDDGVFRCLPADPERGGLRVFADEACDVASGLFASLDAKGCEPGYLWHGFEGTGCDSPTSGVTLRILERASASRETHPFVLTYFGTCNPLMNIGGDPGPSRIYCTYEVADSATFVAAEEDLRAVGGVRQRVLVGEDGSLQPHALLHPDLSTPLMRDPWSGTELVPAVQQWDGLRDGVPTADADPACSQAAICFPDEEPSSPIDPVVRAPDACVPAVLAGDGRCSGSAYELGARIDGSHACDQSDPAGLPHVCYERARALPPLAYEEVALGNARLRPIWIASDGEPLLPTGYFHDEQLGTTCTVTEVDGRSVCDPWDPQRALFVQNPGAAEGWVEHFADDACQDSLGFEYRPRCAESPPAFARAPEFRLLHMRSAGAPEVTATFTGFSIPGGGVIGCSPAASSPRELFTATPIEPSELAEVEEVVR